MTEKESFSTEEIIQITSTLSTGEYLWCSVPITPVIRLEVHLNSHAEDHGWIRPTLIVQNRKHMRRMIPFYFQAPHADIQRAIVEGRDGGDSYLSVQDIINIFELDSSVKWQLCGVTNGNGHIIRLHP